MEFIEVIKRNERQIDFWGYYVSVKTDIEKEDVKQMILIELWKIYRRKAKRSVNLAYIRKRLKFIAIRIMNLYYASNEIKLNKVSLELCKEDCYMFDDVPFFETLKYIREKVIKELSSKHISIIELLIEGKTKACIAEEIYDKRIPSYVDYAIGKFIRPVFQKYFPVEEKRRVK